MKICVPKEIRDYEKRVALTPETAQKIIKRGYDIVLEAGAGLASGIHDAAYEAVGVKIAKTKKQLYEKARVILKVQAPQVGVSKEQNEIVDYPEGAIVISQLNAFQNHDVLQQLMAKKGSAFALERIPRITRAQAMDILSSQSNLAGYRAVLVGVSELAKALPMMMTAAGTVMPAKVLVIGAGVAGLQAIATAKRLGAVVSAFDVRPAAREQVESLGAKFIEVDETEDAETTGGYAKEMSEAYKKKQAALVAQTLKNMNLVITTALIPGRPAPQIITQEMVEGMPLGSVIVDMAVEAGGNCALSKMGETVNHQGVKIVGMPNLPSQLAADTTPLFARNVLNFMELLFTAEGNTPSLNLDSEDEIVKATLVVKNGDLLAPDLTTPSEKEASSKKIASKPPKEMPPKKEKASKKPVSKVAPKKTASKASAGKASASQKKPAAKKSTKAKKE